MTALRSRDVAAAVFRMLDPEARQQMASLTCQTRDALLIAACVDPYYWHAPSAALVARALTAQRVLLEANVARDSCSVGQLSSSSAPRPPLEAARAPSRRPLAGPTARRWGISLRSSVGEFEAEA